MDKLLVFVVSAVLFSSIAAVALAGQQCDKKCCQVAAASKDPTAQDVVIDPVCGMDVKVSESKYSYKYKGKTYHFCSESCLKSFSKNPSKYIGDETKKKGK